MKNDQKVFLGFLTGLAAGVITGILIAPDKGKKTRKKIKHASKTIGNAVGEKLNKESLGNAVQTAKTKVNAWMGKDKEIAEAENLNGSAK